MDISLRIKTISLYNLPQLTKNISMRENMLFTNNGGRTQTCREIYNLRKTIFNMLNVRFPNSRSTLRLAAYQKVTRPLYCVMLSVNAWLAKIIGSSQISIIGQPEFPAFNGGIKFKCCQNIYILGWLSF